VVGESGPEVWGWRIWAGLQWIRRDRRRIAGGTRGCGGITASGDESCRRGLALTEPGLLSAAICLLLLLAPSWANWAGSGGGLE
jgi:hypothetical protein